MNKIVFWGSAVGKSSIIKRLLEKGFSETYVSTLGMGIEFQEFETEPFELLEVGGKEEFRPFGLPYLNHANIIFLVFDRQLSESFEKLQKDIFLLKTIHGHPEFILLETRIDCHPSFDKKPMMDEIYRFKKQHHIKRHMAISAKTNAGVDEVKSVCLSIIHEQKERQQHLGFFEARMSQRNKNACFVLKCCFVLCEMTECAFIIASLVLLSPYFTFAGLAMFGLTAGVHYFFKDTLRQQYDDRSTAWSYQSSASANSF